MNRYIRDGKCTCATCDRSNVDLVFEVVSKYGEEGVRAGVVARHLKRIEEYGPKGATPTGFCQGSLQVPKPEAPKPTPRPRGRR